MDLGEIGCEGGSGWNREKIFPIVALDIRRT
jgi:hypothetical protein